MGHLPTKHPAIEQYCHIISIQELSEKRFNSTNQHVLLTRF